MIRTFLPIFAALVLTLIAPLGAQEKEKEKEHPPEVRVEVLLTDGDKVVERAAVLTDLNDENSIFQGTTTLRAPEGGRWVVEVTGFVGPKESERELTVYVSDPSQLVEAQREGTSSVQPVQLFSSTRLWHGPGIYRIAEQGNLVLSVKVTGVPELDAKAVEGEKR